MGEFEGIVKSFSPAKTKDGRNYNIIELENGEKYSYWNDKVVVPGTKIFGIYKQNGIYKNIEDFETEEGERIKPSEHERYLGDSNFGMISNQTIRLMIDKGVKLDSPESFSKQWNECFDFLYSLNFKKRQEKMGELKR